jgi:monofunctional biosynthetic peptidoglycan transglycosylase
MPRLRRKSRSLFSILAKTAIGFLLFSILLVLPLRWFSPVTTSFMLQSAVFGQGGVQSYSYQWRSFDKIAPTLPLAAIAGEDQRFPDHNGFDIEEIQTAIEQGQTENLRGASTISQQVAKNLYLWSGRSFVRKGLEAWLTVLIEFFWTKQRILEMYVNVAQFAPRTFGAEAASQSFFGIPASQLSVAESARLAAVLPGPEIYSVANPSNTVLRRQDWILQQMQQLGGVDYLNRLDRKPR